MYRHQYKNDAPLQEALINYLKKKKTKTLTTKHYKPSKNIQQLLAILSTKVVKEAIQY